MDLIKETTHHKPQCFTSIRKREEAHVNQIKQPFHSVHDKIRVLCSFWIRISTSSTRSIVVRQVEQYWRKPLKKGITKSSDKVTLHRMASQQRDSDTVKRSFGKLGINLLPGTTRK